MNSKTLLATVLIVLGVIVLAYSGISFTTPGKTIEFLGMHIATTESHFIPPVIGLVALLGGVIMLVVKPSSTTA
jgi:hypothetical protein